MPLPSVDAFSSFVTVDELTDFAPVTDPTTDVPASAMNILMANSAMSSRMMPRAYVVWQWDGAAVEIIEHDAVWGNSFAVQPTVVHSSTGLYTITWPATVADALGDNHNINLKRLLAPNVTGTTMYHATCQRTGANTGVVRVYNTSHVLADPVDTDIEVWAR